MAHNVAKNMQHSNNQMPVMFLADILKSSIGSSYDSKMPFAPLKVRMDGSQDFKYLNLDKLSPMILKGAN